MDALSYQTVDADSLTFRAKNADIPAKGHTSEIDEVGEALDLFSQLDAKSKDKFLAFCRWACDDRSPDTDPRKLDPYWQDFPDCLAVKMPLR